MPMQERGSQQRGKAWQGRGIECAVHHGGGYGCCICPGRGLGELLETLDVLVGALAVPLVSDKPRRESLPEPPRRGMDGSEL